MLPASPRFRLIRLAVFCTVLLLGLHAGSASAQNALFTQRDDAVGVGVWYGTARFSVDAPTDTASNEVKGYTDILPSSMNGKGPAIGISFGSFGLNYGYVEIEEYLGGVKADVNQTPANLADDVTVLSARLVTTSITVIYQPLRYIFVGYGKDSGTIEFVQLSAGGVPEQKKLPIDSPFYSLGLAIGFDPTKHQTAPILTVFAKLPAERTDFNGRSFGAGVGLFF